MDIDYNHVGNMPTFKEDGEEVDASQNHEGNDRTEIPAVTTNTKGWQPGIVTIEPVLFLYLLAAGVQMPAFSALLYDKVCLMNYNNSICDNLHNISNHDEEDIVQTEASKWFLYNNYVYEFPAILLTLVYGSISDKFSRKLVIALPVVGQALGGIVLIFNAVYMNSHVGLLLIGSAISGISGSWITIFMASFSYLSEATTAGNRTKRTLVAEGVAGLSMGISLFLSGIILDNTSYKFVFSLSAGLCCLCVIYILVYLKEPPRKQTSKSSGKRSCRELVLEVKDAVTAVLRKRENKGRSRILVCIMIMFTGMISGNAIHTVGFLFLKRRPLSWSQSTYGIFVALWQFIPSICLLAVVPCVKSYFKLRDTTLLIFGLASNCLSEFWFSFCTQTWMAFLVPILACFRGTTGSVLRSVLSQLVQPHELGQMFAMLGSMQSLSGIIGTSLFNTIYPHTLTFWPGFCFTLGTIISVIPASLTWWLHRDLGRSPLTRHLSETCLADNMNEGDKTDEVRPRRVRII